VSGPEVVQGDPDAELAQLPQAPDGALDLLDRQALGNLEDQVRGRQLGPGEHLLDLVDEGASLELLR
jgi:hypothetical protein